MNCPSGHSLPRAGPRGECTPMYCSEVTEAHEGSVSLAEFKPDDTEEGAMQKALERERVRNRVLKTPKGLQGAHAEEFVSAKMTELSVLAAMELEGQLRFGNDAARRWAAEKALAATGHGPKDAAPSVGALIVIQTKDGSASTLPPWKRKKIAAEVVDAVKKDDEDPEDGD